MRPHSPSRVAAGRAAKAAGDAFEAFLEEHHDRALQRGILAFIQHNQATTNVVGGRLIYTARGAADYSGVLNNGSATAVAIEAKSTKDSYLPRSAIELKQAEHLDAVAAAGGLALLLVEFRDEDVNSQQYASRDKFAIPWKQVPWKVKKTAESLDREDLFKAFRERRIPEWWIVETPGTPEYSDCYLSRFFAGTGIPVTTVKRRVFARE